ncbi:MAG: hypothetical protein JO257_34695 [Deltaproteobacteria bacterium]|nr:hypothetical protein [Deltaproteobacteria bacterium]
MKRAAALVFLLGCHASRPVAAPTSTPAPAPAPAPLAHAAGRADVVAMPHQPLAELVVSGRPCGPAPITEPRPLPLPPPHGPIVFVGKPIDPCARGTLVDRR